MAWPAKASASSAFALQGSFVMPLSPPAAPRKPLHVRKVVCQGYRREDGLWDIEGRITDEKTYSFENEWRGQVKPGDFVHDMHIRLTLDDRLTVIAVEAVTDASPFPICPAIAVHYQRLVGLRIASGWTAAVRERLGGVEGCTHLSELLGPIATSAFQTIMPVLDEERRKARQKGETMDEEKPQRRPLLLNSCHAFSETSPVTARFWPEYAKPAPETKRLDP
jgi:Protein of unknown function (DUF2889)